LKGVSFVKILLLTQLFPTKRRKRDGKAALAQGKFRARPFPLHGGDGRGKGAMDFNPPWKSAGPSSGMEIRRLGRMPGIGPRKAPIKRTPGGLGEASGFISELDHPVAFSSMIAMVPRPASLSIRILPRIASMSSLAIDNPRPLPLSIISLRPR